MSMLLLLLIPDNFWNGVFTLFFPFFFSLGFPRTVGFSRKLEQKVSRNQNNFAAQLLQFP